MTNRKEKTIKSPKPGNKKNEAVPRTLVGIEVDGTEVHVAYVEPAGTVHVEHFRDTTPAKALDGALKSIPGRADIVRVAFTGGRQYVRRVEVPRVPDRAMRAAMMAVAEENLPIVPGAASVAGLIIGNPDDLRDSSDPRGASNAINMALAAVESDDLDPVWRRLGGRRAPITSASFLLPADGLYLRVARSTSEMIILKGGTPLVTRSLRVGGLDELEHRIFAGEQAGFNPSINGTSENSDAGKSAAEITDFFLDELVSEFRKTLVFWKREGVSVPSDIIVLGAGATIPTLLTRIRDAGFNINPIPEPRGVQMSIADHEKPIAFQALAAAYSDFSHQPYAILPNPVYDAQKIATKRKVKQRSRILLGLVVAGSITAAAVLPLTYAWSREAYANKNRNDAEKAIVKYAAVIEKNDQLQIGESAVKAIEEGVPAFTKVVCSVRSSAPNLEGVSTVFKTMALTSTETGTSVDIGSEVVDPSPGFNVFGDWRDRIALANSTNKIGVGSFKFNPDTGTKDGSFRWVAPLTESFRVPNVSTCDGYVDGLSTSQLMRIEFGFEANDESVALNANGELIDVATKKKVKSQAPTTTTTKPETTTTPTTIPVVESGE